MVNRGLCSSESTLVKCRLVEAAYPARISLDAEGVMLTGRLPDPCLSPKFPSSADAETWSVLYSMPQFASFTLSLLGALKPRVP